MAFSRNHHLIAYFLLFLIPYAASLSFDLKNINQNLEIVTEGEAYISDSGIQMITDENGATLDWKAARATYVRSLHLWDNTSGEPASFATNFSFVIHSRQGRPYADGLTFFLAQKNSMIEHSGSMGLPFTQNNMVALTPFVAVEFDTHWNEWDPRDSSNNSVGEHVGISISSLASKRWQKWLSNVTGGAECQAWVTYDSVSKNLSVSFTGFRNSTVVRQVGLHYIIDLRDVLPERVIFGFSASTGLYSQTHIVKSWTFDSMDLQIDEDRRLPLDPSSDPVYGNNNSPISDPVGGKNNMVGLIIGLPVSVTLLAVVVFVLWRKKKKKNKEYEGEELEFEAEMNNGFEMGTGPTRFSYHELAQSTNNFAETEKLGEGGFGGVYRGFLKDSRTFVAVKRVSKTSKQGIKEYASEVRIISRLRHRNLVQLIGWCHEKRELLLVYELMENGSLDSHLFNGKSLLTWGTRYKIAHGLASALLYLHEEWEQCVLHRDIKSSNVILDSNFNPKLGDFGLAKLVDHEKSSQTTILAGTLGYMAPECVLTGKASKESDVFSFGVAALEIACGRKPIEYKAPERKLRLVEWVWELYGTGTLLEAADPRLGSDFTEDEIKRLMIVGLWCVHPDSDLRPSIRQAIQVLNSEASLPILPSKMPVASYLSLPIASLNDVLSIIQNQLSSSIDNTYSSKQAATSATA